MTRGRAARRRAGARGPTWLVVAALVVGTAACVPPPPAATPGPEPDAVEDVAVVPPAATGVLRRAQEVTVRIRSLGCRQLGLGSGFVLPGGIVVTNRHVLDQPLQVTVNTWDGRSLDARVAGVASDSDLAVLRLVTDEDLPVATLRDAPVEPGEQVVVVGYPGGGPATVTRGEVLALVDGTVLGEPADVIRIDARIAQGSSGGPLLDEDGRVVGVVFALETRRGTGLAVPVSTLLERLDREELRQPAGC